MINNKHIPHVLHSSAMGKKSVLFIQIIRRGYNINKKSPLCQLPFQLDIRWLQWTLLRGGGGGLQCPVFGKPVIFLTWFIIPYYYILLYYIFDLYLYWIDIFIELIFIEFIITKIRYNKNKKLNKRIYITFVLLLKAAEMML